MRRGVVFAGLALLAGAASAAEIAKDWKIVVPKQASAVIQYGFDKAAKALRNDLAECAGLKLEIVEAVPKDGSSICLGADLARAAGLSTDGLAWFDNVIAEKDGNLYFFGNDRARAGTKRSEWFRAQMPTIRATVRFMRDYMGVRFYMPGETGREVARKDRIVVPDGTRSVERPSQIYAQGRPMDAVYGYAETQWGMGLFHSCGGHTHPKAVTIAQHAKEHPEYFAMTPDGRRSWAAGDGMTALCISNPEVEELILGVLLRQYDSGAEVCELAQQDGTEVCHCEKCRALYGTGDDWGEKLWCFHRHIAERVEKLRPGKVVQIISYCLTEHPPKTFRKFPSNVMVELCRYSEADFRDWREYEVPQGFTVYVYFWGNYPQPGFIARHSFAYLAEMARLFRRNNVKGIYRCGFGELFGLEGPGYRVFNELLENPERPVDEVVSDYCRAMFGAASVPMQRFYDAQDERLRGLDLIQTGFAAATGRGLTRYRSAKTKTNGDLHAWAYPPDVAKVLEDALASAEATEGLSDKVRRRLDLVRREFNYARSMGEIAYLYGAYRFRPTPAALDALGLALDAREQAILALTDARGLPGWPELRPVGGSGNHRWLKCNGRLSATMGAPLSWDIGRLKEKGALPGLTMAEKTVVRADAAPTLDDLVAETGVWSKAPATKMTGVQGEENLPETTLFRLAYDDRNLYVGVRTDLKDDFKVAAFDPDGYVWRTENLDLYVAPAKTIDVHYHLIWSPVADSRLDFAFGLITEPLDPAYNTPDIRWNGKWTHEDRRTGNVWYSLLKIPYADLGGKVPKPGDAWRFNLGRTTDPDQGYRTARNYIWSQNLFNSRLDYPEAMGKITFE